MDKDSNSSKKVMAVIARIGQWKNFQQKVDERESEKKRRAFEGHRQTVDKV
jgi:hypothetical protein